jgi:hypothetical protein
VREPAGQRGKGPRFPLADVARERLIVTREPPSAACHYPRRVDLVDPDVRLRCRRDTCMGVLTGKIHHTALMVDDAVGVHRADVSKQEHCASVRLSGMFTDANVANHLRLAALEHLEAVDGKAGHRPIVLVRYEHVDLHGIDANSETGRGGSTRGRAAGSVCCCPSGLTVQRASSAATIRNRLMTAPSYQSVVSPVTAPDRTAFRTSSIVFRPPGAVAPHSNRVAAGVQ